MRFELIDRVIEASPERVVATKCVTNAEEYLADHFPTYPVLPGVLMLEALVQASRKLLAERGVDPWPPMVLSRVRALKYGRLVRPGDTLRIEVTYLKACEDGTHEVKGLATVVGPSGSATDGGSDAAAASGRLTLRPGVATTGMG